jgi:rod shape-determining protein MreD
MIAALTIVGGLLLIILESVSLRIFGVRVFAPELVVVLVVYVGFRRSFTVGAAATLLYAAVADLCWGGPRGYYALGLTLTFFICTLLRARWRRREAFYVLPLVPLGVVVTDLVALVSLTLFQRGESPLGLLRLTPLVALWTTVFALPFVWIFVRIERLIEGRARRRVA